MLCHHSDPLGEAIATPILWRSRILTLHGLCPCPQLKAYAHTEAVPKRNFDLSKSFIGYQSWKLGPPTKATV